MTPLTSAAQRFGRFHGLTTLTSTAHEDPASIRTISFRYSTFHSRYLVYDAIVSEDVNLKPVDPVPAKVRRDWHRFDARSFPFMDFGGKVMLVASSFDPRLLKGLARRQIAADLNHPKRPVAKAIDGTANQLTAAICVMTKNKPKRVCGSKTISGIRRSLKRIHS